MELREVKNKQCNGSGRNKINKRIELPCLFEVKLHQSQSSAGCAAAPTFSSSDVMIETRDENIYLKKLEKHNRCDEVYYQSGEELSIFDIRKHLFCGVWCLVFGVWCLVSGVWCPVSGELHIQFAFFVAIKPIDDKSDREPNKEPNPVACGHSSQ